MNSFLFPYCTRIVAFLGVHAAPGVRVRRQAACKPGSVLGPEGPMDDHSSGTSVTGRLARSTRAAARKRLIASTIAPPLFDLAPGGVYLADAVTGGAVRSYRTLSPLPPGPGLSTKNPGFGGLLSVALSLGSPPPGVTRHRLSVEPGLSSSPRLRIARRQRSSSRLTPTNRHSRSAA